MLRGGVAQCALAPVDGGILSLFDGVNWLQMLQLSAREGRKHPFAKIV